MDRANSGGCEQSPSSTTYAHLLTLWTSGVRDYHSLLSDYLTANSIFVAVIGLLVSRESLAPPFALLIILLCVFGVLLCLQMAIVLGRFSGQNALWEWELRGLERDPAWMEGRLLSDLHRLHETRQPIEDARNRPPVFEPNWAFRQHRQWWAHRAVSSVVLRFRVHAVSDLGGHAVPHTAPRSGVRQAPSAGPSTFRPASVALLNLSGAVSVLKRQHNTVANLRAQNSQLPTQNETNGRGGPMPAHTMPGVPAGGLQTVGQIHATNALVFRKDQNALGVAVELLSTHTPGAPVVDERSRFVGFVSEFDVLRALEARRDLSQLRAQDIMAQDRIAVTEDTSLEQAVKLMEEKRLLSLPVERNGTVSYSITRHDLLRAWIGLGVDIENQGA